MSKLGFTKRILAGLISFAMVFQGMAAPVIAAEANNNAETVVDTVEDVPVIPSVDAEDAVEEDPGLEVGELKAGYTKILVPINDTAGKDYHMFYGKKGEKLSQYVEIESSDSSATINGLLPDTEYDIVICTYSEDDDVYYYMEVKKLAKKTLAFETANVSVSSSITGELNGTYTYTVPELPYAESVNVHVEVKADGKTYDSKNIRKNLESNSPFTYNFSYRGLPGGQEYTVTTWITVADNKNAAKYCVATDNVTPTASPSAFGIGELTQCSDLNKIKFEATDIGGGELIYVWYKSADSSEYKQMPGYVSGVIAQTDYETSRLEYLE